MKSRIPGWTPTIVGLVVAGVASAIGWSSAQHLETLWDEVVDQKIAVGLRGHPLVGEQPTLDGSQMRLPMYVNALVFAATGGDDLETSRAVSLGVGAAAIMATALLGRMLFGPAAGALAAVLLGFSPYFLSFSRIAMTEGDVFAACCTTLAVAAFVAHLQRPTAARWVVSAITLALALGSKAYAAALLPAFALLAACAASARPFDPALRRAGERRLHVLLAVGFGLVLATAVAAPLQQKFAIAGWGVLAVLWCCVVLLVLGRNVLARGRLAQVIGIFTLAVLTLCVLMPVHLVQHDILRELARSLLGWGHRAPEIGLADRFRLYSGILSIKFTVPLGVLTVGSMLYGIVRSGRDASWRTCSAVVVLYLAAILALPLRQTFYLMSVYPLLAIMTASLVVRIGRGLPTRRGRGAWSVVVAALLGYLGVSVYGAYPHYHLYGYDLIGDRWLGAESRGYRNLIQTPSDGVESLIRWCNTDPRVRPGAKVVSYLWEDLPGGIVDRILPAAPHYVLIRRGLGFDSDVVPPGPSIDQADFVLLHINNFLGYGDRSPDLPSMNVLNAQFEPAYIVRRGSLEVGWVYGRRR